MDETPSVIDIQAPALEAQAPSPEKIAAEDANREKVNSMVAYAQNLGNAELRASQDTAKEGFGEVFVAGLGWKPDSWGDTRKG